MIQRPSPLPRPRLNTFEWIQVLLVLWVAASELLRGGIGVTMLPQAPDPGAAAPLPAALLAARMALAAAFPLLAFVASRRRPLWSRPWRHLGYYLGALALLHAAAAACGFLLPGLRFDGTYYLHRTFEFVVYTVFAHGMLYGERHRRQERQELGLRAAMAASAAHRLRAQVRALRMEWSPRFLTDTLEAIGDLLSRDAPRAKRLLLALSSVLRRTLAQARTDTVPLETEVEFVREVLQVEALRRPGLQVEWAVDEDSLDLPVPPMALTSMVYQALSGGAARLRVTAAPDEAAVALRVEAFREGAADAVRLEMRAAAAEEHDAAPAEPLADGQAPAADGPVQPAAVTRLEAGTYAAFLLFYTLLALYTAAARVEAGRIALAAPAWVYVAGSAVYATLWWGSLAMAARWLSGRYPIRRSRWARGLAVHALGAVIVCVLNAAAYVPFERLVVHGGSVLIGFRAYWEWGDLAVYPPLAGIAHGFVYAREYHVRLVAELRLRSRLSESEMSRTGAELRALKAELNPHFLFNTLNTVASLMHTRPDEARRVVAHLSALLRRVLQADGLREVTVAEEVEFIRLYMEIEQARFGDALRITYEVDPAALGARVPHLLVQPLMENAVKHGLRPRDGTGRVVLSARRSGAYLELEVADDGVGPGHAPSAEGTGTGLANVRQRLRGLYGAEHAFELAARPGGGAVARIRIPFTEQPRGADHAMEEA